MPMNIKKAASVMGSIGGKNGTGESKRRPPEYYKKMAIAYWTNTSKDHWLKDFGKKWIKKGNG